MCGRFTLTETDKISSDYDINIQDLNLVPRFNIAPAQDIPVIVSPGKLMLLKWGLIPYWAKDPAVGSKLINARAETLEERPSFKYPLRQRRCLVLADGFYEWQQTGRTKIPYRIALRDRSLFTFAGLWDTWQSPAGSTISSCSIITTTPNSLMQRLHQRMPVILPRGAEKLWLDSNIRDVQLLKNLLVPYPAELMRAYQVSSRVNSPKNDDPECIEPVPNSMFI